MEQVKFNTIDEVIEDYLTEVKGTKDEVETYYHNYEGKKKLCVRIKGTKFMDTFKTYKVNSKGQFLK